YRVGRDIKVRIHRDGSFSYNGIRTSYDNIFCPLAGRHQIDNAAVALGLVESLTHQGLSVGEDTVLKGIREARWEGRLEVIRTKPIVLLDGAHNAGGAAALSHALAKEFSFRKLIFVFGVLQDKDYVSMLRRLLPLGKRLILTRPNTERAMPPEAIVPLAQEHIGEIEVVRDSRKAVERALAVAGPDDLICVTGSLYLVGEIKRSFSTGIS
ncbi:MAG TPA: cyanophycin synthetase, partial [Syntrophales bacterium]|nr:cyanophycin synthetase [Syntrophales bacterium]